jgi:hypothetical protein
MRHIIVLRKRGAREVLQEIANQFGYIFTSLGYDDGILMDYHFYGSAKFKYHASVWIQPSKDDKKIIIHINKKEFPSFIRDNPYLEKDAVEQFMQYLYAVVNKEEIIGGE